MLQPNVSDNHYIMRGSDIILVIVAIIFPPAAAFFIAGCSCDLLINVVLTILGYIPGHLHAFWLIHKRAKAEELYGPNGYRYVGNGEFRGLKGPAAAEPAQTAQMPVTQPNYGATSKGS